MAESNLPAIVDDLRDAEVVIIGGVHGNPDHNKNQQLIIRAIFPSALVFEAFSTDIAAEINAIRWEGTDLEALGVKFDWDKSGWPSFDQYIDLLNADPEGVVYGAAVSEELIAESHFEGAFAIYGPDGVDYHLDISLSDVEISKRQTAYILSNCGVMEKSDLAGLIEADRLRAAVMSDAVLLALEEASFPVVVITGNGMAREDYGVPAMLRRIYPDILVKSVAQFEGAYLENLPFTHILSSETISNEDPCLDFSE